MRARWAYALALASLGEPDESAKQLSDALSDAFAFEMPAEVSALCSALAKVSLDTDTGCRPTKAANVTTAAPQS